MSLATLREIPGVTVGRSDAREARVLPLHFGQLDEVLPDGGLPRGAVVEIATPYGLSLSTSIGLAACASAQEEAKLRGGKDTAGAWCAWIEASATSGTSLFAPAAAKAGIDLARLLVIRPPSDALARIAARAAASGVFSVVVVDLAGVPGQRGDQRLDRWVNAVRRLAMSVEGTETAIVLLTDGLVKRAAPLPVALRLEVDRAAPDRLTARVAKERRGRVGSPRPVAVRSAATEVPAPPPSQQKAREGAAVSEIRALHAPAKSA